MFKLHKPYKSKQEKDKSRKVKAKRDLTSFQYEPHFTEVYNLLNEIKIVEKDYFKNKSQCFLGMRQPFEQYYNDEEFDVEGEVIGWNVNPDNHLNLGVIAGAGIGKTRHLKNIVLQYWKLGWKVLIFTPKQDEWSGARIRGRGRRLHPKNKNEKMPIISYCPAYIKHYLEREEFPTAQYKFYSHSLKTFTSQEKFEHLGMTSNVASFCVGLIINKGIDNLRDLKSEIEASNLATQSKKSALLRIDTLLSNKYFNPRLKPLDLDKEWLVNNNIIAINYFAQDGIMMSSDVTKVVESVKKWAKKHNNKIVKHKILVLFDDANYYCGDAPHNYSSIRTILDCQIHARAMGIDNITSYQFPEAVNSDIVKGSTIKLISYVEDASSLKGVLPIDARYILQANEEDGGLVVDKRRYIVQWIYRGEGREFWLYYPEDCRVGH